MRVGDIIKYKRYDITKHLEDDYVVEVGHDTLKDAKDWINRLIDLDELEGVADGTGTSSKKGK